MCLDELRLALPPRSDVSTRGDLVEFFSGHAWVSEHEGSASREWLIRLCRDLGFEPDIRFVTDDLLMHCRLVQTGHAVAVLPGLLRGPPMTPLD